MLLRGKLFAGALFAGLLFGEPADQVVVAQPAPQSTGGGSAGKADIIFMPGGQMFAFDDLPTESPPAPQAAPVIRPDIAAPPSAAQGPAATVDARQDVGKSRAELSKTVKQAASDVRAAKKAAKDAQIKARNDLAMLIALIDDDD